MLNLFLLAQFAIPFPIAPMAPPLNQQNPYEQRQKRNSDWMDDYGRNKPREMQSQPQYNAPGVELHGATTEANCYKMEKTFKQQGRNLKLTRVNRTNNPGAVLRFLCVFEGIDAQAGWFDEKRY